MSPTFDEFVAERLDPLLRYATVLTCDAYLAQDVVQESLLRAQQRWPRIAATGQPAAYVKRMVTNEYLSWRRRRARTDVSLSHAEWEALGRSDDPADDYDARDTMLAEISALPAKQRAAVVLRYYEDYSDAEIAALLGCREGTVRSHISRALTTLRAIELEAEQA
ncbi:SigE family RNA polymerase sigma factor [Amycolatopsis magusensis]|uniref:RNA polymerase sigma-70 factor (Sigma-E family) n=1 Tax=Amycolatopsis magusensis TaxID=882444 RepID=A0ABS4PKI7_9PSEU|nr:SigE family RNA polymerase sigma factor [Amycolatopsis magusensis]MBP2179905.1 RNA polymerase sigma-70 factor (sigma-E family) [Amycolatopsis magusensis]